VLRNMYKKTTGYENYGDTIDLLGVENKIPLPEFNFIAGVLCVIAFSGGIYSALKPMSLR